MDNYDDIMDSRQRIVHEQCDKMLEEQEREAMKRRMELENSFNSGVITGIKLMEQRMLLACENGTPIALSDGRAYFIHNDLQNLQRIFADLEADAE